MEIFMKNVAFSATPQGVKDTIAEVLHSAAYRKYSDSPLNFSVNILPPGRKRDARGQCGKLTVPSPAVGRQFLATCGGLKPKRPIRVAGMQICFTKSWHQPCYNLVEQICRLPFRPDVHQAENIQTQTMPFRGESVPIDAVQLGWFCRDQTFSIEWEQQCRSFGQLTYDAERRAFQIRIFGEEDTRIIVIHVAGIYWASAHVDAQDDATIILESRHAHSFETGPPEHHEMLEQLSISPIARSRSGGPQRRRWCAIDPEHESVAPYVSNTVRVICAELHGLTQFRQLCIEARLMVKDYVVPVDHRELFCRRVRQAYSKWVRKLKWGAAFQVEALTRGGLVDLKEALSLRKTIHHLYSTKGTQFTCAFLQSFITQMKTEFHRYQDMDGELETVDQFMRRCLQSYTVPLQYRRGFKSNTETQFFYCLHAIVTPTTIHLDGPHPERFNRVIRWYPDHHDHFLRVSFADEVHLQYRFDRDVDGRDFIARRVGSILTKGLEIAGRHFHFLAYSQSALKEHSVWFVRDFYDEENNCCVTAESIIKRIGTFEKLYYDPKLIYCPARYGARVSHAFTSTDSSVSAEAEEVIILPDVMDSAGKWAFTDGVGTISPALARAICMELRSRGRRARYPRMHPKAFQIRFMGSKGMLSVDHKLSGRAICIRPSMIKFDAPNSLDIEIAQVFDKPGPLCLNRPLIMILEALGVEYKVFQELQDDAVANAKSSSQSLSKAELLLERHGLGSSYRVPMVIHQLTKLGIDNLQDKFYRQMVDFAVNHALRELKHHARIPVKQGWNLVGVADVHGYLKEGEIFAHIASSNEQSNSKYLEGQVLVSRSPTIHPGDVQVVHAIGKPPRGSPFEKESLPNCVVFSIKGTL